MECNLIWYSITVKFCSGYAVEGPNSSFARTCSGQLIGLSQYNVISRAFRGVKSWNRVSGGL